MAQTMTATLPRTVILLRSDTGASVSMSTGRTALRHAELPRAKAAATPAQSAKRTA